jgi:U3 small nucleolar RNA-associated protein 25
MDADDVDDWNSPTTKLLTLLNVSAAKSSKRKFSDRQSSPTPKQKLNKRRVETLAPGNDDMETTEPEIEEPEKEDADADVGVGEAADVSDAEGV